MRRINFVASALGRFLVAASGVAFLAWIGAARATPMDSAPAVDLELILAADVSGSMTKDELRMQREGYINALRDVDVINATLSGTRGRIAVAYLNGQAPMINVSSCLGLSLTDPTVRGPLPTPSKSNRSQPTFTADSIAGEPRFPARSLFLCVCFIAAVSKPIVRSLMFLATAPTTVARP